MPDEPIAATNPVPPVPDPQKAVDEALSPGVSPAATVAPTPNSEAEPVIKLDPLPQDEPVTAPLAEETKVPTELLGVPSSTPNPTSTPIDTALPPLEPSPAPAMTANGPVTDDMPLAFAASAPTSPMPLSTPDPLATSPFTPPPAPLSPPPIPEKKKGKGGKILAMFIGFLLLLGGIGGGYWYYMNNFGEKAVVAEISQSACRGCIRGGWAVWRNGSCHITGICDNSNPDKNTENPTAPDPEIGAPAACHDPGANGNTCCGTGYTYCGGAIDRCVSHASIAAHGGGCNSYGEQVHNIPTVYGANATLPVNGVCTTVKTCTCGSTKLCFDKPGFCDQQDFNRTNTSATGGTDYNAQGLCAVAGTYDGTGADAEFILNQEYFSSSFTCSDTSCTGTGNNCFAARSTCTGTVGGNSCTTSSSAYVEDSYTQVPTGQSLGFQGRCGTVEQIDITCGSSYITSRTRINPPCAEQEEETPNPSVIPSVSPTLACTGLTKDKPTPAIGDVVKFTCAGSVTPAGATSLTYQFRLRKDGGAWQTLSATGANATYTVASAGAYDVQCKACGTINNASICDPTWTGATTQ